MAGPRPRHFRLQVASKPLAPFPRRPKGRRSGTDRPNKPFLCSRPPRAAQQQGKGRMIRNRLNSTTSRLVLAAVCAGGLVAAPLGFNGASIAANGAAAQSDEGDRKSVV